MDENQIFIIVTGFVCSALGALLFTGFTTGKPWFKKQVSAFERITLYKGFSKKRVCPGSICHIFARRPFSGCLVISQGLDSFPSMYCDHPGAT